LPRIDKRIFKSGWPNLNDSASRFVFEFETVCLFVRRQAFCAGWSIAL